MSFQPYTSNDEDNDLHRQHIPLSAQTNIVSLVMLRQSLQKQIIDSMIQNEHLKILNETKAQNMEKKQNTSETKESNSQKSENSAEEKDCAKNDTKNIPKNFGKAIITFIQKHDKVVKRLLVKFKVNYPDFVAALKGRKKNLNSIADLRSLWVTEQFRYAKITRILSLYFLKRGALRYIFSSRVVNYEGHIKYRKRLIDVLKCPEEFTCIKTG